VGEGRGGGRIPQDYKELQIPGFLSILFMVTTFNLVRTSCLSMQFVEMADVAKFFVNHAVSDNLGKIANAHLAMCDKSPLVSLELV